MVALDLHRHGSRWTWWSGPAVVLACPDERGRQHPDPRQVVYQLRQPRLRLKIRHRCRDRRADAGQDRQADPACTAGDFSYGPVDHDQRNTLNTGFTANLPRSTWISTNVYYGSGFTNGLAGANQGPWNGNYLPVHTTFDLSGGHSFGENWHFTASILNVTNHRVLLDNSVTIGGFHDNDPRQLSAQLKYRFHF